MLPTLRFFEQGQVLAKLESFEALPLLECVSVALRHRRRCRERETTPYRCAGVFLDGVPRAGTL